jgi:DNA-binding beta-propeller fold protein YncE
MTWSIPRPRRPARVLSLALLACGLMAAGDRLSVRVAAGPPSVGTLVAYEPLPPDICVLPGATPQYQAAAAARGSLAAAKMFKDPTRKIKDPYPSFAAVAVDPVRNEVVFTDESLFKVLVYDRLENTMAGAEFSKPKREIVGHNTDIEFQSGVYVDPKNGEIIAVNNDTRDTTVTFAPDANGDVKPVRAIKTPHGTFGIAVAEAHNEVLLTLQHDSSIIVYRKGATEKDSPLRFIQGDKTKVNDPHGIAYDPQEDVVFVANFGSRHEVSSELTPHAGIPGGAGGAEAGGYKNWPLGREWAIAGSGSINPPSIVVHRRNSSGNIAPLRVIEGPATQFNWPTGLAFDPTRRELYVANDMGPSILVFDATANGNAAPKRVLKGPRTGLTNPTGVSLDLKNNELWVANFGGHSGTVYDLTASGDTPPKRTIRNAPAGAPSLMIGNPGAVAYDSNRENILVPN